MSGLLHHAVHGAPEAPAVVLLHPIATRGAIWNPQASVWSNRFRVVVPDLPGHGKTPLDRGANSLADHARRVVELLDGLAIEKAAVVGLSFGGMVAQALAIHHPQRVDALVLAHCGARTADPVRALWTERLDSARQHGMAAQVEATLARWFTPAFAERAPQTLAWVGRMIETTPLDGYAAAVGAIQALDHLEHLAAVACPTLVVAGRHDAAIPAAAVDDMVARLPNASCVWLDSAHLGNIEQPTEFTEHVGAHLLRRAFANRSPTR